MSREGAENLLKLRKKAKDSNNDPMQWAFKILRGARLALATTRFCTDCGAA